jgi:hypothetical protein
MHPRYFQRSKKGKRGNVLVIAVGLMIFITTLFFVVSSYESQLLQDAEIKLSAKNASLAESSITQALRAAVYIQYMANLESQGTPPTQFTSNDFDQIITQAGNILGVTGLTSGTSTSLTQDSGGTLFFSITKPTTGFPVTMGTTNISGTGSWLDGTPCSLAELNFTIAINATAVFGSKTAQYTAAPTRGILMCKVNPSSLALEAESDLTLSAGTTVTGNMAVTGNLLGAGAITGNVATGSIDSASQITQAGVSLNRGIAGTGENAAGFSFQGQTEIAEYNNNNTAQTNQVRQSNLQRVDTMVRPIPTDQLYREGLAGGSEISSDTATQELYKASQPYYSVPSTYRVYGTYSTAGAGSFTPIAGAAPNQNYTGAGLPSAYFVEPGSPGTAFSVQTIQGVPKLVVYLNLQDFINHAMGDATNSPNVRLFIGGTNGGGDPTTNFSNMVVVITGAPELYDTLTNVPVNSLTIISPNEIIFQGNINTTPPPGRLTTVPFTVIASSTAFGLTGGITASFTGQIQGSTNVGSTISMKGADNNTNTSSINLTSTTQQTEISSDAAGQSLYIALIQQQ